MNICGMNNCSDRCFYKKDGKCFKPFTPKTAEEKQDLENANRRFKNMSGDYKDEYWDNYFCTRKTWQL